MPVIEMGGGSSTNKSLNFVFLLSLVSFLLLSAFYSYWFAMRFILSKAVKTFKIY